MTDATHEDIINEDNPITDEVITGTETEPAPQIPEKYQGKSMEDIIEMHLNAEREMSRMGNELGENRKLVDRLLQTEQFKPAPQAPVEEELDWDYATEDAAKKLVQKEVGSVDQKLTALEQRLAVQDFKSQFPNFDNDATSPDFQEWVQQSPYRVGLYQKNYNGLDIASATELMTAWEDVKSSKQVSAATSEAKRQEDLKNVSLEKGASTGASHKKKWSRAYIRHLRLNDPAKYSAHYDEIQAAYAEDRVTK